MNVVLLTLEFSFHHRLSGLTKLSLACALRAGVIGLELPAGWMKGNFIGGDDAYGGRL